MSRQQIHMLRKKARGICLTCGKPALGVYCLEHTIKARERMRVRLNYHRRLRGAPSYVLEAKGTLESRRPADGAAPSPRPTPRRRDPGIFSRFVAAVYDRRRLKHTKAE